MAKSPAHRFGQIIGDLLEELLAERLKTFCEHRELFLDKRGARKGVRKGSKLTWTDRYGNDHDLDFVIEKGGAPASQGRPIAFVEAAWRRYTKHSRNKVQEIAGAVVPISEIYDRDLPFMGAVLAGHFSHPSLVQLRRLRFEVVHLGYEPIIQALESVGISARFTEETPDEEFASCVSALDSLTAAQRQTLKDSILRAGEKQFEPFFSVLQRKLDRHLVRMTVLPLFGSAATFVRIGEAVAFLNAFDLASDKGEFQRFEIVLSFSNGDEIRASVSDVVEARRFIEYAMV